jgi:YD repeat-containing protein
LLVGVRAYSADYFHDDLGRIIQAQYPDGSVIRYGYDNVGNRLSQEIVRSLVTLSAWPHDPVSAGSVVTFTAAGKDAGPYEYRFWLLSGGQWHLVQDYGISEQWIWNTQGLAAGTYSVQADLRIVGSPVEREAFRTIPYSLRISKIDNVVLAGSPGSPVTDGTNVVFAASVNGAAGPCEYQFWLRQAGGAWAVARPFGADNGWSWDTSQAHGIYSIQASARPAGATDDGDFSMPLDYVVSSRTIRSMWIDFSQPGPVPYGATIKVTPHATEGVPPYRFRYRIVDIPQGNAIIREASYDNASSWNWDTAGWPTGTFSVEVSALSSRAPTDNSPVLDNEAVAIRPYRIMPAPVDNVFLDSAPVDGTTHALDVFGPANQGPNGTQAEQCAQNSYAAWVREPMCQSSPNPAWMMATACGSWSATKQTLDNWEASWLRSGCGVRSVAGRAVTFSALARGGVAPYGYKFTITDPMGRVIRQDSQFSTTGNVSLDNTLVGGSYTVSVVARSADSVSPGEAGATLTYSVPIPRVDNVMLEATAPGGTTHAFEAFGPANLGPDGTGSQQCAPLAYTGFVKRPYCEVYPNPYWMMSSAACTTLPVATADLNNWETSWLNRGCTIRAIPGRRATFTASARGGQGRYEYKFTVLDPNNNIFFQSPGYSTANSVGIDNTVTLYGNYTAHVYARSSGSSLDNEATATVVYNLIEPVATVSITAAPVSPQVLGTAVVFTASANGGAAPAQYRFRIRDAGGAVVSSQAYGNPTNYSWNTAGLAAGSYTAEVCARSNGSSVDNEAVATTPFNLTPTVSSVSLWADPPATQAPGTTVTFTATPAGGTAPVQYRFRVRDGSGTVIASQAYGTASAFAWSTTGLSSATYTAEVSAKSNGSPAPDNEAVGTIPYTLLVPVESVTLSASPASPRNKGAQVTFTATASGGVSPCQYQFVIKNGGGTIVASQAYGAANTYVWNSPRTAGTYTVEADARSNGSTSPVEASTTMSYKLK